MVCARSDPCLYDDNVPTIGIDVVQRVVARVFVYVERIFIPDGISLQGLSVLTRFFVGVGKIPISDKSIGRASAP